MLIPQHKLTNNGRGGVNATLPKHKDSVEFERADRDTKKEAMQTLRSFCQTGSAIGSLQGFEMYMSQNDSSFSKQLSTARHEHRPRQSSGQYPPVNPAKPKARKVSDSLPRMPPNIFQKGSNPNKRGTTFTKSFTLASFRSTDSFSSPGSNHPSKERLGTDQHARELSYHSNNPETGFRGAQERSARPDFTNKSSHFEDVLQRAPKGPRMPLSEKVASIKLNSEMPQHIDSVTDNHKVSAVSVGFPQPLDAEVTTKPSSDMDAEDAPTAHSRRFRKSDSMKKLFDASIKGFRNMGQRVSNTGGHDGTHES